MQDKVAQAVAGHVARVASAGIPAKVADRTKAFIADSLAVGVAGRRGAWCDAVSAMAEAGGRSDECTVLGSSLRLPPPQAAMLNAFQIHNQEFDCVHEGAIVHPMAGLLPAMFAWAERQSRRGAVPIDGRRFVEAVTVAVDVAATLGLCSRAPMRFFRPANAGGFGGVTGIAMLAGFDERMLCNALGAYYGQCAGTMQAHVEGTPQLAMQVGFASRAAVTAAELAARGMPGPQAMFCGQFGYFELFEGAYDLAPFDRLGSEWRIAEVSHKPFPTGRATHGGLDGLRRLLHAADFHVDEIDQVEFHVPQLVERLVGRPPRPDMAPGYARLCLSYVGAICLMRGTVSLADFDPASLADPAILALAERLSVVRDSNPDPNALTPQRVVIRLRNGEERALSIEHVLGSPGRALPADEARAKFDLAWRFALPEAVERAELAWRRIGRLEEEKDVADLLRLCAA